MEVKAAAAASHIAKKDESRLVISIDFKTDLIDLFEGNKKTRERSCKAVNLIREFPSNLMLKLLIILEEKKFVGEKKRNFLCLLAFGQKCKRKVKKKRFPTVIKFVLVKLSQTFLLLIDSIPFFFFKLEVLLKTKLKRQDLLSTAVKMKKRLKIDEAAGVDLQRKFSDHN